MTLIRDPSVGLAAQEGWNIQRDVPVVSSVVGFFCHSGRSLGLGCRGSSCRLGLYRQCRRTAAHDRGLVELVVVDPPVTPGTQVLGTDVVRQFLR